MQGIKALVTDFIAKEGVELLKKAGFEVAIQTELSADELKSKIKGYDVLVVRSRTKVTKEIIDNAENLRLIARAGVGVDNIDTDYAAKKGVAVMTAPEGARNAVAELVLGLILAVFRNIATADRALRQNEWKRSELLGKELARKTIGIIGFGRIGQLVAARLKGFQCKFVIFDPLANESKIKELDVSRVDALEELFRVSDVITLHVPLTEKTRNMINKEAIAKMKEGVVIINTSRGGIVNEDDLYDAILRGRVGGAGIDTWAKEPPQDNKLLTLDKVVATSHLGASTEEAQRQAGIDIANQIMRAFKRGGEL